jgi:hypothetical protein
MVTMFERSSIVSSFFTGVAVDPSPRRDMHYFFTLSYTRCLQELKWGENPIFNPRTAYL